MRSKILLSVVAGWVWAGQGIASEQELKDTVTELRQQIEFLTSRLQQLEQKLDNQETKTVQAPAAPVEAKTELVEKKVDIGDTKGSFKIPGTETSLAIGGYVKLDAIYNSRSVGGSGGSNQDDQYLNPGAIPVSPNEYEDDQVTFHARQSRFWLKSFTPSEWGDLNTYLEMDFFAFQAPGNERVSNSYSPRLRHAFGSLGNFLAGQTWTTFMSAGSLPELNDFGGPVGRVFVRQPLMRWTQPINEDLNWMFAVESPESTLTVTDANGNPSRKTQDSDDFPDIVTRLNYSQSWGTVSLAAMVRKIQIDSAAYKDEQFGGAVSMSGRIKAYQRDDVRFMLSYGDVLGRYVSSNLFNDGAINRNGNLELFDQYGGFVAYRHWWNETWRSNIAYGFSYADNIEDAADTVSKWSQSAQINLLWSPLPQTTFGLEYTYAERELENGDNGDLSRVQFSGSFNF
jgi:hypothetical protein